ncbi:MAG TPA: hypothetical protein VME17_10245 [Bryobacteraceae bacterium]|nr:hypothetical protein [Bryobacteraceae bacterium]
MTAKSLLIVSALALSSLGIASAKSYDVTLLAPAMAGTNELKPGVYKVKIEGSQAVFTDVQDGKSVRVPVKVENNPKKFGYTELETANQNGMDTIRAIELGDSNTRITLGQ